MDGLLHVGWNIYTRVTHSYQTQTAIISLPSVGLVAIEEFSFWVVRQAAGNDHTDAAGDEQNEQSDSNIVVIDR